MLRDATTEFERLGDLHVVGAYVPLFRRHGLTSLEAVFGLKGTARLDKPGLPPWRERLRWEFAGDEGQTVTLYAKRYQVPPSGARREHAVRGSRSHGAAWVEWQWMCRLAADGLPCARPVAYGEGTEKGRRRRSALIIESAPGESLERWAAGRGARGPRSLLIALADMVRRFHDAGYVHRDLYLSHIYYDASAAPGDALRLIDLQRVMKPRFFKRRWQVKDLASLEYSTPQRVASASDRVRFFKRYLGIARLGTEGKRMVRRIVAKAGRIARHDRRRAARLTTVGGAG